MNCFILSRLVFASRQGRARARNSGPALPWNIPGPTSIYRTPLFVTGPCPPSGALPPSLYFAATHLGPRFRDRFQCRNEDFRHILSAKDTPDREYALSFAIWRTFSTEERPEIHIPRAKLLLESRAPGNAPQKPGTRNGDRWGRGQTRPWKFENGAPGMQGTGRGTGWGKKKMIPCPTCPGVNTSLVSWPYV